MADTVAEEQLSQRHKKERRELQAHIQNLKKSICKGDKKKKKEVMEEIVRLESKLDKRHDEESLQLEIMQVNLAEPTTGKEAEPEIESVTEDSIENMPKVSKAQKRRDRKANAERERNERIMKQEAINVFGKRNVETQTIRKILVERDLMIYEIPSDGHCLYNAISHQLKVLGEIPLSIQDLRTKTSVYLRENMNDFLPFLSNPNSDELFSPEQFENYCDNIANTSAWGGAVELQVLSRILQCAIEIIQATGAPYLIGMEFAASKKVTLTYHRYMYELGAHYNSVTKFVKDEES